MRLAARIRSLERRTATRPERPCTVCGGESQAQGLRVVFGRDEDVGPDSCPRCGRPLVYRVEFDKCG